MEMPQRCAIDACGRVPVQIEHYNTGEDTGEDTGVAMAVCSGHTGVYSHRWPMTGIDPILGRVAYATQPTGEEEQRG